MTQPGFYWSQSEDGMRDGGGSIFQAVMPSGQYFVVQEVSAGGVWGWVLMGADGSALEMRNGYDSPDKAKEQAESWYQQNAT